MLLDLQCYTPLHGDFDLYRARPVKKKKNWREIPLRCVVFFFRSIMAVCVFEKTATRLLLFF